MIMIAMMKMIITSIWAAIALDGYIGLLSDTRLHRRGKAQHIVLRPHIQHRHKLAFIINLLFMVYKDDG